MHLVQSFDLSSYGVVVSLEVFTASVVGGLGALFGGVIGAVYLRGIEWFVTSTEWRLLFSASGVLFVLLVLPGGLGGLAVRLRDHYVRWVTGRPVGSGEADVPAIPLADEPAPGDSAAESTAPDEETTARPAPETEQV